MNDKHLSISFFHDQPQFKIGQTVGPYLILGPNSSEPGAWYYLSSNHGITTVSASLLRRSERSMDVPGGSGFLEYIVWYRMWDRCTNPKHSMWKHYGGKGVKVCEAWKSFRIFLEDVGRRPSEEYTLDRYPDNTGDYAPGNVRWATLSEQHHNKTSNRWITFEGRTMLLTEWARELGICDGALSYRLRSWDLVRAMTEKPRK